MAVVAAAPPWASLGPDSTITGATGLESPTFFDVDIFSSLSYT
jgi:hypothetical protein